MTDGSVSTIRRRHARRHSTAGLERWQPATDNLSRDSSRPPREGGAAGQPPHDLGRGFALVPATPPSSFRKELTCARPGS